jgi:5-bromo-4-chloroindolyl phosphate hydrolysis protein
MAERFEGKYSPGRTGTGAGGTGGEPFEGRGPGRMAFRVNLLFLVPFAIAIAAFTKPVFGLALMLVAFADLMVAAWLTREGLKAEDAYNARKVARPPAIPRKLIASILTGSGLCLAMVGQGGGIFASIIIGLIGGILHSVAFGFDPMKSKGMEEHGSFQSDRVAKVVDEAENHLGAIQTTIAGLRDRHLTERVENFIAAARKMCRSVEDDPRDLTSARKYLGVYLLGAKDATTKFAEIYAKSRDTRARSDYEALLDDLEQSFAARTERMLLDDRSDLDIEINVLRERLEREGVRAE